MWYIMQSVQSKYSLSERLIRTIAAIRSFPRDNVEDLIGRGADVNCMHGTLKPLHCACMVADADCVELLLQKGAEVNALDGYNRTACTTRLRRTRPAWRSCWSTEPTPTRWTATRTRRCTGRPSRTRLSVCAHCWRTAPVNARDYNDDTPLSWAAMKGNLESVSILLDFGAEVRVVNLKGQTPISRLVALLVRGLGTEREDSCFDLLHRAIGHFELRKNGSMPWEVTRDQQLCEKLTLLCSAPGTLQTLSRYAVRRSLGVRFLPEAVEQLPLPTCLKEYVLLLS
uniref:Ankyrin repeat and SOCS box protein 8 n=1 Tax=Gallus gallus TaxID=9031 RepID=A0A8V1A2D6_CHICK